MDSTSIPPVIPHPPIIVHPDMSFMLWFGVAGVLLCSGLLYEILDSWFNPVYGDEHHD